MRNHLFSAWIAAFALVATLPLSSHAQQQMTPGNARAIKVAGTVWQQSASKGSKARLKEGDFLQRGATIETSANGTAVLLFENGSTMQIQPSTRFSIREFLMSPFNSSKTVTPKAKSEPSSSVTEVMVHEGTVLAHVAKLNRSSTYNIATPLGTAGIRGTTLGVRASKRQSIFVVTEGLIQVTRKNGTFWVGGDDQPQDQSSNTRTAPDRRRQDDTVIISLDEKYRDYGASSLQRETRTFGQQIADGFFGTAGIGAGHSAAPSAGEGEGGGGDWGGGAGGVFLPGGFGGGGGGGGGGVNVVSPGGGGGGSVSPPKPYGQ